MSEFTERVPEHLERPPRHPGQILKDLRKEWLGSEDQLDTLLEELYHDIRSSFRLAGAPEDQAVTVDDYVSNTWFG